MQADDDLRLLTVGEVADILAISVPSLYRGIARGKIPKPIHPTGQRAARWRSCDIAAYIEGLGGPQQDGAA